MVNLEKALLEYQRHATNAPFDITAVPLMVEQKKGKTIQKESYFI
jgi:hypothetical protein